MGEDVDSWGVGDEEYSCFTGVIAMKKSMENL